LDNDQGKNGKTPPVISRARSAWWLILLLAGTAILHFSSINGEINGLGGDNAGYINLARSLAGFEGYRNMWPGYPPATHWPPVFPFMLVPMFWIFGLKMQAFHFVVVTCELTALVFLYILFRRDEGSVLALLACGMFALNPFVNLSLVRILSEFPYIMFTAAAILVSQRAEATTERSRTQLLWLPLLVVACYMTRIAGLSMLAAFLLYRVYRRQWNILAFNIPLVIIPYAIWEVRKLIYDPGGFSYFSRLLMKQRTDPALGNVSLGDFTHRVIGNAESIGRTLVEFTVPYVKQANVFIVLILAALVLFGLAYRWVKGRAGLLEIYVVVYTGMLLVWPVFEPRKVMPVIPFVYMFLFVALGWISERLPWTRETVAEKSPSTWYKTPAALLLTAGAVLALGQASGTRDVLKVRSMNLNHPPIGSPQYGGFTVDWSHFRETYYWVEMGIFTQSADRWANYLYLSRRIGEISPPDTAVIARKGTLAALYSGRPAKTYPYSSDFEVQRKYILDNEIDYVIIDGMFRDTANYMVPFVQENRQAFTIVERKGNAFLLKVDRSRL
jgi:hypothetical protein